MKNNKLAFYTSILLLAPVLGFAQAESTSSQLEINPDSHKAVKIEGERAVSVNVGRSQIGNLKADGKKQFQDENTFGVGFQRFLSNRFSVNVNMNFGFNGEGEQSYYTGGIQGTYHRPIFNDRTIFRAAAGLNFSEFQFSAPQNNSNKAAWLEGVAALGVEYKLRKDVSILSSFDVRQAGFSNINNETVEGTSYTIQPIGLVFYY
jgi:hypothetical protein